MIRFVSVILIVGLWASVFSHPQAQKGVEPTVSPFKPSKYEFKFENQWAFMIGINNYAHINDLDHPVSETRKIEKLLIEKYGFLPSKKKLRHDLRRVEHLYSEQATYYAIRDRLYWYSQNLEEEDSLFIYFSGHGYVDRNDNAYWLPHDVTGDMRYKHVNNEPIENSELKISLYRIMTLLDECKAKHILVVVDACYCGAGKLLSNYKRPLHPPPSMETRNLMGKKSRQILVASAGKVPDPSPFSRFIIDFLVNNSKPYLLATNLIEKTKEILKDKLKPKGGHIWNFDNNLGEFVFTLSNFVYVEVSAAPTYYNWAHNYLMRKRYETAIYYYQKTLEENPTLHTVYNDMAVAYTRLGEKRKAIETLLKAIKINPDYADAYYNIGYLYDELRDYREALYYYKEALRINPNFADAYNNIGVAHYRLGEFHLALEAFKKAVEINYQHAPAYFNLSEVYQKLGRKGEVRWAKGMYRRYK